MKLVGITSGWNSGGVTKMISIGEFKGHKIISLKRDENDKFPFSFGKSKAKLIVENIEAIKQFADEV